MAVLCILVVVTKQNMINAKSVIDCPREFIGKKLMHKLFHISPERNINTIIKNGIIPFAEKGLTNNSHRIQQRNLYGSVVWLTDNVEYIIQNQIGEHWINTHNPYIFTVNVAPYKEILRVKIAWYCEVPVICPHEFYIPGTIESVDVIEYKPYMAL
jgi:hypothetical protein